MERGAQEAAEEEEMDPWEDDAYFASYADPRSLQKEMLADERRNRAYRTALEGTATDKVVLDVGCGTGLLSFQAARAGATRVYGVECSDIARLAHQVCLLNQLSDRVHITQMRVEDLHLDEQVDLIVSEWMGSFLFFESMAESLIKARVSHLKPDGLILPSKAALFMAPAEWIDPESDFWNNVDGFDYRCIGEYLAAGRKTRPVFNQPIAGDRLRGAPQQIGIFDMSRIQIEDLECIANCQGLEFVAETSCVVNCFVIWFDVYFPNGGVLSTSPFEPPTHWNQELLLLDRGLQMERSDVLHVSITCQRNSYWRRHYYFVLDIEHTRGGVRVGEPLSKVFPHHRLPTTKDASSGLE